MSKVKKKKPIIDLESLNSDQKTAFEDLRDFIGDKGDDNVYVLKGWAGTGKTYCVSVLVRYVLEVVHPTHNWYRIAVTGPTNKSVRVIKKTSGLKNPRVTFQTIHKLLGLTERITKDGLQEFVNQGDFEPKIKTVKLLIIDEVSMLNDDLFQSIIKYRDRIKIICMGDPAQIPPVGRIDCIPFREELAEEYRIKTLSLKQIMRQKKDNAIIESSVAIRSDLSRPKNPVEPITNLNEKGEGIEFLNLNTPEIRKGFSEILRRYFVTDEFKKDPEYAKVIAWRNKTVATMNDVIRKVIYGDEALGSKILVGEKLIANNPVIQSESIVLNTNDEFSVESFTISSDNLRYHVSDHPDAEPFPITLKYYETVVSYLDDEDETIRVNIQILHEDSEEDFKKLANMLKSRAIEKKGKDKSWLVYYNFLRKYADVNYAYCTSAHKSQGSTYNTTFVLEDDIDMNWDIVERNRIKYTSYTRSSRKLYVLKRF
jgi:exodeoxyribonuclease-5